MRLRVALIAAVATLTLSANAAASPTAASQPADAISTTSAEVHGTIGHLSGHSWYAFAYGTTTAYGKTTARQSASWDKPQPVSAALTGLSPATTYHVAVIVADDKGNITSGGDVAFTTAATPATPSGPAPVTAPGASPAAPASPLPSATAPIPTLGQTVVLGVDRGSVRVRAPGAAAFSALTTTADLPVGTIIDARAGTVALQAALVRGTQTATLRGAVVQIRQPSSGRGMTDLVLRGGAPAGCAAGARAAAVAKRRPTTHSLWAHDDGGRFRTRGRNSVATVRGTTWVTTETCAGTRTRVISGAVSVRDLRRHRVVTVRAGHSYLARSAR